MPVTPTYPGVYIEELPSGVRTIGGVATSVAAFAGAAPRGPIARPVRVQSFADYERRFGGLAADSEMGYAVRAFFNNGGADAWIVRLTLAATAAHRVLRNRADTADSLRIEALDAGAAGNAIAVRVVPASTNPDSRFDLTVTFDPPGGVGGRTEFFPNLSLNSADARYAEQSVNGVSQLVRVQRLATAGQLAALPAGQSISGPLESGGTLLDVAELVDDTHNQLRVSVNGSAPVAVVLNPATDLAGGNNTARLASLCTAIRTRAFAASGNAAPFGGPAFCAPGAGDNANRIVFTSAVAGERSTVRVLPGERHDVTARLRLGLANGGREIDAVAGLVPAALPLAAVLTGEALAAGDIAGRPSAAAHRLRIALDGYGPDTADVGTDPAAGANFAARLTDIAARIQAAVRALKPANPAYRDFTCTVAANRLVLSGGTRGAGASIAVSAAEGDTLADDLGLLGGAAVANPVNAFLENGDETPYAADDVYPVFIGSEANREGIFALEAVDLFNLLVLPGVTDPGVLQDAEAYCRRRRAFLIAEPPVSIVEPSDMETYVTGPSLPKSNHAAVFYPWIRMADPLQGGRLRTTAPGGAVAGLFARTDATRGVWKAPAGTEAALVGVQDLTYRLTDGENGILNPRGVNCLRLFPVFGAVCWGARTLQGDDAQASEWKYIPVRRTALFIEESLYRGTQWAVFEPNDEPLWAQLRLNVGAFMNTLFRQGAFAGATPREAYLVKCDRETTTADDVNRGIVNILVAFAPLKPAEFVIVKIQQLAGQLPT